MKLFLNIISAIGVIIWTAAFFFSIHYLTSGAFEISIPVAIFAGIVLGFFINRLKYLSNRKNDLHRKSAKTIEIICLCLYAAVSLATAYYITHTVAVTMTYKAEVQEKALAELDEIHLMFFDEGDHSYSAYVADQCHNYCNENPNNTDAESLEVEAAELEEILMNKSGFNKLQSEVETFWGYADAAVRNWNWLYVGSYLAQLEKKKPEWEAALVEFSATGAEMNPAHYEYEPLTTKYDDLDDTLTEITPDGITIAGIVLIIVLQAMMLMTYLAYSKSKNRGPEKFNDTNVGNISSWR